MRKATILLLLLTLCLSTAAFADAPQLGSGARSDGPMVGGGVGDGPALGSGVGDSPMLGGGVGDTTTFFSLIRFYLGI